MSNTDPTQRVNSTGGPGAERTMVAPTGTTVGPTQVMPAGGMDGDAYRTQLGATTTCPVCKTATPATETYCGDCGFLLASAPEGPIEVPVEEAPPAELVDVESGRRYRLHSGVNTLGRQGTDILTNEGTVSRLHARIVVDGQNVTVEDLGSSNGTKIGDRRPGPNVPTPVAHGTLLKFGNWRVRLEIAGQGPVPAAGAAEPTMAVPAEDRTQMQPAPAIAPPPPPSGPKVAILTKIEGPAADIPIYEGTMTIGRRSTNTIALPQDAYISGRHAEIVTDNTGTYLTDLGSTNGTTINGERLTPNERQLLLDGDEVQIGQNIYRFSLLVPEEAEELAETEAASSPEEPPAQEAGEQAV